MFKIYTYFLDGIPDYLAKYYWWAYLWPKAVWFFDHQPIINAILFGQYKKLMSATLKQLEHASLDAVLQLTCVYGSLTPHLNRALKSAPLHITDAALVQLDLAQSKVAPHALLATRMNAEYLGYKDDAFSTIIVFFLLHEMPHQARLHTLAECMRTLQTGGTLIMTEYGSLPSKHALYRFLPTRWIITKLEPFLQSFWHEDVEALLNAMGLPYQKKVQLVSQDNIFASFYRVVRFKIIPA